MFWQFRLKPLYSSREQLMIWQTEQCLSYDIQIIRRLSHFLFAFFPPVKYFPEYSFCAILFQKGINLTHPLMDKMLSQCKQTYNAFFTPFSGFWIKATAAGSSLQLTR